MKNKICILILLGLFFTSCNDYFSGLHIKDENNPDIEMIMNDINQYPALIGGSYNVWWTNLLESSEGDTWRLATNADAYAAGAGNWGIQEFQYYANCEKPEIQNTDPNSGFTKKLWYNQYGRIHTVRNMLFVQKSKNSVYKEGGVDQTHKILANCYFLIGAYYAELSLLFDQAFIITEDTYLDEISVNDLKKASEVKKIALSYLDKCIEICEAHSFENFNGMLPSGVVDTSDKLKQIANFMAARTIAYFPRTNKEQVDWQAVKKYADNGLSADIKATLPLQGWDVWSFAVAAYPEGNQWARVNMRIINMMAKNAPEAPWPIPSNFKMDQTLPEVVTSPDYRLGTDFIYYPSINTPSGGLSYGGYTKYSSYVLRRFTDTGRPSGAGELFFFMKAESDLLKAEALLNTGAKAQAIPLIQNTRLVRGKIDDISATSSDANVLKAIYYERFVECGYAYAATSFYDRRRTPIDEFQLATRSFRQLPVPILELNIWELEGYTFGGERDKDDNYKF